MSLVELPDCWGCDTDTPITHETARAIAAATYEGNPIRWVARYVSFIHPFPGDLTGLELRAILDAGLALIVVCHPPEPGWTASGQLGALHGTMAARNAHEAGYEAGAYLFLDLEGLANAGEPVIGYANEWCRCVSEAGYRCGVYVGYASGLSPLELYELPLPDRYWSDAAGRQVAARGVCCRQGPTVTIAGLSVDPDRHFADMMGGRMVGMGAVATAGA